MLQYIKIGFVRDQISMPRASPRERRRISGRETSGSRKYVSVGRLTEPLHEREVWVDIRNWLA